MHLSKQRRSDVSKKVPTVSNKLPDIWKAGCGWRGFGRESTRPSVLFGANDP